MKRDRVRLLGAALAGLTLLSVPAALALPTYRKQAAQQFRYGRDTPLWDLDRRVVPCTYCHVRAAQAGKHSKFPVVLHGLLVKEDDADGDGYSGALEVYARTLPGDATSYPKDTEKELRAAYEKAGGVAQYAPPRPRK